MNEHGKFTLAAAWLTLALHFVTAHWNEVLSTAGVISAIIASVYTALASRAKKKHYEKLDNQ